MFASIPWLLLGNAPAHLAGSADVDIRATDCDGSAVWSTGHPDQFRFRTGASPSGPRRDGRRCDGLFFLRHHPECSLWDESLRLSPPGDHKSPVAFGEPGDAHHRAFRDKNPRSVFPCYEDRVPPQPVEARSGKEDDFFLSLQSLRLRRRACHGGWLHSARPFPSISAGDR